MFFMVPTGCIVIGILYGVYRIIKCELDCKNEKIILDKCADAERGKKGFHRECYEPYYSLLNKKC